MIQKVNKMDLTLRIPKEVDIALKIPEKEKELFLLKELAISLYQRGVLSFGKARELASMTKWEFYEELGERGIPRHYTVENFKEDLLYGKEKED
jgi:predicted HTH domain antitoxin